MMTRLLPPDYEAVLVKLLERLPLLTLPDCVTEDGSSEIRRDPSIGNIVDPIAVYNTRNTGCYNV